MSRRPSTSAFGAALFVAATLAVCSPMAASGRTNGVRGGSGVVSTYGVGAHHFETTSPAVIRAFAGAPNSVQYLNRTGEPSAPRHAVWKIWTYSFAGGSYVQYSFHRSNGEWHFSEFNTNRTQFRTPGGTRVGMTYAQAKNREHAPYIDGCIDSGFWHFRDGHRYDLVIGVNPGHRVHALHAAGPGTVPC